MSSLRYSGPSSFYRELAELPVPTSAKFINTFATSGVSGQQDYHLPSAEFVNSLNLQSFASPIPFAITIGM
ncbi:hypothetical protein EV363DRAFT_1170907 [Boletus edulis]|uniref:Uncharacterized protein n=1 Tax=Boletus edulis BED1 TaxID=1328754 RepID=A0AAD4BFP1_BOLED|nr:hypothetical protein EV363DRAFT_1170907 [Boletus edulis]KAF8422817.1 hypothetical protein L210DRAFT_3570997 [Boletus edulis BED1]KAF8425069.1 hypothetical protein L210DRAFT_3567568 [Boletus edulis BED1]